MIRGQCDRSRARGIQIRKLHFIFRADLVADDDLVDVVELVPVVLVGLRRTTFTKLPHETRRLSHGRIDGVTVA